MSVMRALCVLATLAIVACDVGSPDPELTTATLPPNTKVGNYTPGSQLGTWIDPDSDAGKFSQQELDDSDMRDRGGVDPCSSPKPELGMTEDEFSMARIAEMDPASRPHSQGMLTVSFRTQPLQGMWKPANVLAVWIEDVEKRPVRSLGEWVGRWVNGVANYFFRGCRIDVMAHATLADHGMMQTLSWDGKDFEGHIVPDGSYVLQIEVNDEDRKPAAHTEIDFRKGDQPISMTIPDAPATLDLQFNYVPVLVGVAPGGTAQPTPKPAP